MRLFCSSDVDRICQIFVHQTRPVMIGHPAGGYCLGRQVASFSHACRRAGARPLTCAALARIERSWAGPGSSADQLNVAANMPGS